MKLIKGFSEFVNESEAAAPSNWNELYSALSKLNSPKIIRWQDKPPLGPEIFVNWCKGLPIT